MLNDIWNDSGFRGSYRAGLRKRTRGTGTSPMHGCHWWELGVSDEEILIWDLHWTVMGMGTEFKLYRKTRDKMNLTQASRLCFSDVSSFFGNRVGVMWCIEYMEAKPCTQILPQCLRCSVYVLIEWCHATRFLDYSLSCSLIAAALFSLIWFWDRKLFFLAPTSRWEAAVVPTSTGSHVTATVEEHSCSHEYFLHFLFVTISVWSASVYFRPFGLSPRAALAGAHIPHVFCDFFRLASVMERMYTSAGIENCFLSSISRSSV